MTAPRLSRHPKTDSILLGYQIGSASTEHGKLSIVASGAIVRFTLEGSPGYVDLRLDRFAAEALEYLAGLAS